MLTAYSMREAATKHRSRAHGYKLCGDYAGFKRESIVANTLLLAANQLEAVNGDALLHGRDPSERIETIQLKV